MSQVLKFDAMTNATKHKFTLPENNVLKHFYTQRGRKSKSIMQYILHDWLQVCFLGYAPNAYVRETTVSVTSSIQRKLAMTLPSTKEETWLLLDIILLLGRYSK